MPVRLEIALKDHLPDPEGASLCRKIRDYFGWNVEKARVIRVLMLDLQLSESELEYIRQEIFTNPVTQVSSYRPLARGFDWAVWVGFRPGVRDTAGSVALEAISEVLKRSLPQSASVYTSKLYLLFGCKLDREQVETVARELLANEIIQQWRVYSSRDWDYDKGIGTIVPKVELNHSPQIFTISIPSDEALIALSKERNLALSPKDIPIIRRYFQSPEILAERLRVGLSDPTDVELETISQARSDHCNHNTFKGKFYYLDVETGRKEVIDNLFESCIKGPTLEIKAKKDWVVSVLWDNAGVARFDDEHYYVIKGETHNSPSTMEAYGGALTGIVGVYRDPMGTGKGARLIAGLYGYCVGMRDYSGPLRPYLHPKRLLDGIIEGVRDGGNKHGVPTVMGNLYFGNAYLGKCLVFVSALGLMPKDIKGEPCEKKNPSPGDLIIMCGGRVGKDGIHGVTASSEAYSDSTPVSHVQIGDPYTQKKMHDFLLEARDHGLITFITDNGGGGLSSSVGESAQLAGGAQVELDKVPLKYEGLDVWEIWVSESQERMTVAIRPENLDSFMKLAQKHEVEATVIGSYTDTGKLVLTYRGTTCAYLDLKFFKEGFPQWEFEAHWLSPELRGLKEPVIGEPQEYGTLLHSLLADPNLCSREWIQRQYDHEVQGGSVVKFLVGCDRDVPNDAVVIRPILESNRGLAVAQALHPYYSLIDTYHMVAATIDEAVRRLVSVGAKLDEIGGVDNFCWPNIQFDPVANPDGRYKAAQLVRANWALRDVCRGFGIPLLSGKDSMYVDGYIPGAFGEHHKISGLPAMQFTATGVVPDILKCVTMDAKVAGDLVYILGLTRNELGGSAYYNHLGYIGRNAPVLRMEEILPLYSALEKAIDWEILASCRGIYRGGLALSAAMVGFAGGLGMRLNLADVPVAGDLRDDQILFSESCGRFLVTLPKDKKVDFERLFKDLPHGLIGEVLAEPRFEVRDKRGHLIINESMSALKSSWQRPFGDMI